MTNEIAKKEDIGKQIDTIVSECMPVALSVAPGFSEALTLAKGIKDLRIIFLNNEEIQESVAAMANTPLGFVTDRSPTIVEDSKSNPNKKTLTAYSYNEIAECCIEAMLRGYRITGNEFNIMSGRFYAAKDGKYRKIIEYPGITDFRFTTTPPAYSIENRINYRKPEDVQFAKLRCFASWKKNGTKQFIGKDAETGTDEDTLTFKIKAYGNDDDQVIGKALSKLFSRVLMRITGQIMPEMTDIDDTAIRVTPIDEAAPETTTGKPSYDVTENGLPSQPPDDLIDKSKGPHGEMNFTGHRTSTEGPPDDLNLDGSKKEEPPPATEAASPIEAEHFYKKRQPTVQALLDAPGRVEATAGHILRMLWTKIENNKWDIQHPAYLEWKAAQTAGKAPAEKFTGAPTDKIGDDPDHKILKKLHATIREMGLDPVGTQKVMFARFDITSSKDITLQKANDAFSLLDALVPVNGLFYLLQNVQKITDKAGKKVNVIALAIEKIREFSPKITGEVTDLYEIYDKPQVIEWVQDSMDEWIAEIPDPAKNQSAGPPDMPPQKQQPLESKLLPTLKTVMDAVNYAADLTGTSKADLWSPEFTKLASDVQVFIKEGFDISSQELATGLPEGTAEKMREHFVLFLENMNSVA